jgi:hypothetical protein
LILHVDKHGGYLSKPKDKRTNSHDNYIGMAAGQHIKEFSNRYRCKDGSYKTVTWDSSPYVEGQYTYTVSRVAP